MIADPSMPPAGAVPEDEPGSLDAALYVVATPIGNLEDTTLRALSVLRGVDLILAEDTRRTRKLLNHYGIRTPMRSLHEHNESRQARALTRRIAAGESMALVSDAGTPLVSDPGFVLVRTALDADVAVVPVPGASSLLAALVGSGLPTDRFTFIGYLPRKGGPRRRTLKGLGSESGTIVFLESPRRLAAALADAADVLGDRPAVVCRELTKVHEQFIRGTLVDVAKRFADGGARGEVTVCIAGSDRRRAPGGAPRDVPGDLPADAPGTAAGIDGLDPGELGRRVALLQQEGASRNEALKSLARALGVSRRDVYQALLVESEPLDDDPAASARLEEEESH